MLLEEITDKKVLVRLDYNVPIEDGIIVNDFRIRQTYNTLNSLLDNNNKLIIALILEDQLKVCTMRAFHSNPFVNIFLVS